MEIQRQTRSSPGQIRGPAPTSHQVREVSLHVEAMPGGKLRVSTPSARGWAVVVSSAAELNRAVTEAFTESQIAAHARWRGERYDLDDLTEPQDGDPMAPPRGGVRRQRNEAEVGWGRSQRRPDTLDPGQWVKLPSGRWQGPGGKSYGPNTQMAARVVQRRREAGLPT